MEAVQVVKSHVPPNAEWLKCESRIHEALKELEVGYRAQDLILTADVLEYEVSNALDQWQEILSNTAGS
jgi:hypothetical protein